jgi:cell division transport system permease protein
MKYVGATDSFIRLPFLTEGMLIGLIAALISFGLLGAGYTYIITWASENYGQTLSILLAATVPFIDIAPYMLGVFTAIGVLIGSVGSGVFVSKYLKV